MNCEIRHKLLFLGVMMGVATVAVLATLWWFKPSLEERAELVLSSISNLHAGIVQNTRELLVFISESPAVKNSDKEKCDELLAGLLKIYRSEYTILGVSDAYGDVWCNSFPLSSPVNIADRSYFEMVLKTKSFSIGEFQIGKISGKPSVPLAYPVIVDDRIRGAVFTGIDLGYLKNRTIGANIVPSGWAVEVIDSRGSVLFRDHKIEEEGASIFGTPIWEEITSKKIGSVETSDVNGKKKIFFFRPWLDIPDIGGYLLVAVPRR